MKDFARNLLPAAILAGFCCGAAIPPMSRRLGHENDPFAALKKFGGAE